MYSTLDNSNHWRAAYNTATPILLGVPALTTAGCTPTARSYVYGNTFTEMPRVGYVGTSAAAGALLSLRHTSTLLRTYYGSQQFGFLWQCRFGITDAAAVANARMFLGVTGSTAALTNVAPATLTDCIGIGHDTGDTNFKLYFHQSGGSSLIVDLGVDFPCNTRSTDYYDVTLLCSHFNQITASSGGLAWSVIRKGGDKRAGGYLPDASNQYPSVFTELNTFNCFRTNNTTALAVSLDVSAIRYDVFHGN